MSNCEEEYQWNDESSTANACSMYDIRHSADGPHGVTFEQFKTMLKATSKHWVFQLEKADSGYLHWQCRVSLIKKRRLAELKSRWCESYQMPFPMYIRPTSGVVHKSKTFNYAMKADSRVEGPWTDKDKDDVWIPNHIRGKQETLYPFQKVIFDSGKAPVDRFINLIYDPKGNKGKSTIADVCELYGNGLDIPPLNDAKELLALACDIAMAKETRDISPTIIDLPRAMPKKALNGLYTAIEQIKRGKLFDTRYHYKEWRVNPPAVWVFTNRPPVLNLLSMDRWKIWTINDDYELVKYETSPGEADEQADSD